MANESVPPLIDCARVLYYAIVDETVCYTPRNAIYVAGVELGSVPCLAIVRNLVDDEIMLFHCDDEWTCLGSSGKGDVDEVMAQANRRYGGLATKWKKAPYSDAEFAKAFADEYRDERCSFCGRYHFQIGDASMIEGDRAMTCGECVGRFHDALADFRAGAEPGA